MLTPARKAMLRSFGRVFAAAGLAAYLHLGKAPLSLSLSDLEAVADAGIAALLLTAYNYLRPGETRFGRGAEPDAEPGQ